MKIQGIVKKNIGRGRSLGFPTANLELTEKIADGIYLAWTKVEAKIHPSLVFIGAAETFGEKARKAEIYILDFDKDIYGQKVEAELLKKLRDSHKFATQEELIAQMREDEKQARYYFKKLSN